MKKQRYFVAVFVLLLGLSFQSEGTSILPYEPVMAIKGELIQSRRDSLADWVDVSKICVRKGASAEFQLGAPIQAVGSAFGTPDSVTTEYFEMQEKNATIYYYSGSRFAFLDNELYSFSLTGSGFSVGTSSVGSYLSVGAPLANLAAYWPSYVQRKKAKSIAVNLKDGQIMTDIFLSIGFNPTTEAITSLSIRSY